MFESAFQRREERRRIDERRSEACRDSRIIPVLVRTAELPSHFENDLPVQAGGLEGFDPMAFLNC
jgi:hypothetical protein